MNGIQGSPISRAIVKLNDKEAVATDNQGIFVLHNVNAGTFVLTVEADKYKFVEQHVKIELSVPSLPVIVPSTYEVCGKVVAKKSYNIGITKQGSTYHTTINTDADTGDWCCFLPSGKYVIEVLTNDNDKSNGIQFFPVQQTVEVNSQPLKDILFSQLRATLQGKLRCLPDAPTAACLETEVTLHNLDANGQISGQKLTTKAGGIKDNIENSC